MRPSPRIITIIVFFILISVISTGNETGDDRDELCHRDGCSSHHNSQYYQYVLITEIEAPDSFHVGEDISIRVTIENDCNSGKSSYNTFDWVDVTLTSVHGHFSVDQDTKRIESVRRGSEKARVLSWTITGESSGDDTISLDVHGFNDHENNDKYDTGEQDIEIVPASPDISIDQMTIIPSEPTEGDLVNSVITFSNHGDEATWDLTFFVDGEEDQQTDITLGQNEMDVEMNLYWDTTGITGDHTIMIQASGVGSEENTDNNAFDLEVHIHTRPDLMIKDISIEPASPVQGEQVSITVTIENPGESDCVADVLCYLDDPAEELGLKTMHFMGEDLNSTIFTWDTSGAEGEHTIHMLIDPNDEVNETDEQNNEGSLNITVQPPPEKPDPALGQDSIRIPGMVLEGDNITIPVLVRNLGIQEASCTVILELHRIGGRRGQMADGNPEDGMIENHELNSTNYGTRGQEEIISIGESNIQLEPEGSQEIIFYWNSTDYIATWIARAIIIDVEPEELTEANNVKNHTFSVLGRPDLVIRNIQWYPEAPIGGSKLQVNATISNQGGWNTTASITYQLSGTQIQESFHLDAGVSKNITIILPFARSGNLTLLIHGSDPWEWNTTNNYRSLWVQELMDQDLNIVLFTVEPQDDLFSTYHITTIVENQGITIGSGTLQIYLDNQLLYGQTVEIEPGKQHVEFLSWTLDPGSHLLVASLILPQEDPDHGDDENHETRVRIRTGPPNIILEIVILSPSNPSAGELTAITALIRNDGGDTTNVTLSFYADQDLIVARKVEIMADHTAMVTIMWDAEAGISTIEIKITAADEGTIFQTDSIARDLEIGNGKADDPGNDNFLQVETGFIFLVLVVTAFVKASMKTPSSKDPDPGIPLRRKNP